MESGQWINVSFSPLTPTQNILSDSTTIPHLSFPERKPYLGWRSDSFQTTCLICGSVSLPLPSWRGQAKHGHLLVAAQGWLLPSRRGEPLQAAMANSNSWPNTTRQLFFPLEDLERNQANEKEKAIEWKRVKLCYFPKQNITRSSCNNNDTYTIEMETEQNHPNVHLFSLDDAAGFLSEMSPVWVHMYLKS